ncbi:hypothetical protein [Clostridium acidisoli]|nr:hypothetical protein [Clostridium acidisoli]
MVNIVTNTYERTLKTIGEKNECQNTLDYIFKFKDFSKHSGEKSS